MLILFLLAYCSFSLENNGETVVLRNCSFSIHLFNVTFHYQWKQKPSIGIVGTSVGLNLHIGEHARITKTIVTSLREISQSDWWFATKETDIIEVLDQKLGITAIKNMNFTVKKLGLLFWFKDGENVLFAVSDLLRLPCSPKSDMTLDDMCRWSDDFFAFNLHVYYTKSVIGCYDSVTRSYFSKTPSFQQHDQFCSGSCRSVASNDAVEAAVSRLPSAKQVLVMPLLQLSFLHFPQGRQQDPVSTLPVVAFRDVLHLLRDIDKLSFYAWSSATASNFSVISFKLVLLQTNQFSLRASQSLIQYRAIQLLLKNWGLISSC